MALSKLLAKLVAQPGCPRFVMHESTVAGLLCRLERGELDCVIGRVDSGLEANATRGMQVTPGWEERLPSASALDHPVVRKRTVTLADLCDYDWVTTPHGADARALFDELFLDAGIVPPQPTVESLSFCMVASTRLLTVAPESAVRHCARLGMVRQVRHGVWFAAGGRCS